MTKQAKDMEPHEMLASLQAIHRKEAERRRNARAERIAQVMQGRNAMELSETEYRSAVDRICGL